MEPPRVKKPPLRAVEPPRVKLKWPGNTQPRSVRIVTMRTTVLSFGSIIAGQVISQYRIVRLIAERKFINQLRSNAMMDINGGEHVVWDRANEDLYGVLFVRTTSTAAKNVKNYKPRVGAMRNGIAVWAASKEKYIPSAKGNTVVHQCDSLTTC